MGHPDEAPAPYDEKQSHIGDGNDEPTVVTLEGEIVNASGHRDQLRRQYGPLAICGLALTVDNAWVVLGLTLSISIGRSPQHRFCALR